MAGLGFTLIAQAEQSPVVGHAVGQVGQVLRIVGQHAGTM